jgi:hypothetical protein
VLRRFCRFFQFMRLGAGGAMVFDLLGLSGEDQANAPPNRKWNSSKLVEAGPDPQMHRVVRGRCMDLKRVLTNCRSS